MTSSIESVSDCLPAEGFSLGYEINLNSKQASYQEEVLSSPQDQTTNGLQRLIEEEVRYCASMPHLQHIKKTQAALELCKKFESLIELKTDDYNDYQVSSLLEFLSEKIAPYDPEKALDLLKRCPFDKNRTEEYIEISKHQNIIDAEKTLKKAREGLIAFLVGDFDYIGSWYFPHVQKLSLALYNEEKNRGLLDLNDTFVDFLKSLEVNPSLLDEIKYPKSVNMTIRVLLLMHQSSSIIKDRIIEEHDSFMKDFPKCPSLYVRYLPTLASIEGRAKLPQALETLETFWQTVTEPYQGIQMLRIQVTEPYFSKTVEKSVSRILELIENADEDDEDSDVDYSDTFDVLLENNYLELAQRVLSLMTDEYDVFEATVSLYESQISQEGFDVEQALNSLIAQQEELSAMYYSTSCITIFEFAAKYLGFPTAMKYIKYLDAAKESYMESPWKFYQIFEILDIERKYNLPEAKETLSFIKFLQKYGGISDFPPIEFLISEEFSQLQKFAEITH
ncbi:MAG: hypothetical protein H7A42_09245 [Chlamydiales bacterium]|nr:hypothetical protein [Chlamydiales bacterium]